MSSSHYVIDVQDLVKTYANVPVVDQVSLQVKQGEVYGFLGPNGSGKTTTIRMICGLLKPDGGSGTCLGYDVISDTAKIKREVGYMTQHFSLYTDLTIRENLNFIGSMFGIDNREQRVDEAIDRLGIGKVRQHQLAGNLSGGWKQRLALAAATIHEPKLLLLDEPTAGVDPKARREFWDEIHRLSTLGVTALVSTHYMDEAERCSRLAYLAYGKLMTSGTISEVIESAALITMQVRGQGLASLAIELRALPEISSVASFGESLHVSGPDKALMLAAIKPFQSPGHVWKEVSTSLEDVFIDLMKTTQDNFA